MIELERRELNFNQKKINANAVRSCSAVQYVIKEVMQCVQDSRKKDSGFKPISARNG